MTSAPAPIPQPIREVPALGTIDTLRKAPFRAVEKWLFEYGLPFWSENGIDTIYGGFVEQLRLDGSNPQVDFKRTRVLARQIYVFSHAEALGFTGGAKIAEHGYAFLTQNAWLGSDGGWARQLTREGRPLDKTPDLYDLAFVLFGLGWYYRVTGQQEALDWAHATVDFVHSTMRHPSGLGYLNSKPAQGHRLQNPHMHLLEGALSAFEASGEGRFMELADEIVNVFCELLFDQRTGTLPEYFDEELKPAAGDMGRLIEPGHHFEWGWLLSWYQRITGRDMRSYVRALIGFAERYGVDRRSGAVFDVIRNDGLPLDQGERAWPATERLQGAVAMFELDGHDPIPVFAESTGRLLERHLAHEPAGTWIDHFTAEGTAKVNKIPASTLYHVTIAFAEMLRVETAGAFAAPLSAHGNSGGIGS